MCSCVCVYFYLLLLTAVELRLHLGGEWFYVAEVCVHRPHRQSILRTSAEDALLCLCTAFNGVLASG
jgi:hypothetical protein